MGHQGLLLVSLAIEAPRNRTMTIKIADRIRVIPKSYMHLSKAGFLYMNNWFTPNPETDTCVMLGGEYEVLDVEPGNVGRLYRLLPDSPRISGFVSGDEAVPADRVELCPFSVGDTVVFNNTWNEEDYYFKRDELHLRYDYDNPDAVHKITHILNDLYVFLDKEMTEPIGGPFRWQHLSKAD